MADTVMFEDGDGWAFELASEGWDVSLASVGTNDLLWMDRTGVEALVRHLQSWLATGQFDGEGEGGSE